MPDPGKPDPARPPKAEPAKKSSPQPAAPAPPTAATGLSQRLLAEMQPQLAAAAPEGAQAAPGDVVKTMRRALPHLVAGLMELGAIARDGKLDADETKALAGKLLEFVRGMRAEG